MQNVSQRRTLSEQTCFHFAFGKLIVCKMRGVEYSGVEYSGIFKLSENPWDKCAQNSKKTDLSTE